MLKIIGERARGLVARLRIGLQTASDDCLQIAIEQRNERTQTRRRSRSSLMNNDKNIRAYEWWPTRKKVKQDRAQTIYVSSAGKLIGRTFGLLGRDVTRCSKCLQSSCQIATL